MIFVSRKSEMADERKDTFGKERTKGVRVRGSFDSRGRVSSFFFFTLSSLHFFFLREKK